MSFENYKVGQKIGVMSNGYDSDGATNIGEIVDETPTLWIVKWGNEIGQQKRFNKKTGYNSPKNEHYCDNLYLCSEQEAIDTLRDYRQRKDREHCEWQAKNLGCTYSQEFQDDLLNLIKKHKRTK
jgi:hypothetical protein